MKRFPRVPGMLAVLLCLSAVLVPSLSAQETLSQAELIEDLRTGLDYVWILAASALVFLMQAGFMALESGMARAKNSINIAIKNLADFIMAVAGYWVVGFGLMFGLSAGGFFGTTDFFMDIGQNTWRAVFFVFQAVFAGTAATIDSGAVAERTKFAAYVIVSALTSMLIYPIFGHWAWGSFLNGQSQGWLQAMGFLDFAGSTVVHSIGAWVALSGVIIVGPRIGKYDENGKARKIAPHNLPLVYLGTFILFFGWFGFNAGSTLSANSSIAAIALNTMLAACFGGIVASGLSWIFSDQKLPEAEMIANGVLGGLVGITAGCAFVETTGAVAIGAVSGAVVYGGSMLLERVLKLDDVVGAIPVHGFCGVWGTIAVGIFITPGALELTGNTRLVQIGIQMLGVLVAFAWAFPVAFLIETIIARTIGMRVSAEDEELGLNISEHGATSSLIGLATSMARVGRDGHYDASLKVEVEHGTEVGELAGYFNDMLTELIAQQDKIEAARRKRRAAMTRLFDAQQQEKELRESLEANRRKADGELRSFSELMEENVRAIGTRLTQMNGVLGDSVTFSDEMYRSFDAMVSNIEDMLNSFTDVSGNTEEAARIVEDSAVQVANTMKTVERLNGSTEQIEAIIQTIDDITERTRLLSVNASIEAARAGEAGKGFKVVANQVKALADNTGRSALSIVEHLSQIREMSRSTMEGIEAIRNVIRRIESIHQSIGSSMSSEYHSATGVRELVRKASQDVRNVRASIENVREGASLVGERVSESHVALAGIVSGISSPHEGDEVTEAGD